MVRLPAGRDAESRGTPPRASSAVPRAARSPGFQIRKGGFRRQDVREACARRGMTSRHFRRGVIAAGSPPRSLVFLGAGFVDDLELGELSQTFLSELGADARLLGAAERDVR